MRKVIMSLAGLVLLCLSFACPALAQKRVALVVGNGSYKTAPPLAGTVRDARAIGNLLQSLGFDVIEGSDLTQRQMQRVLRDFSQRLRGADVGLFFYAGHGMQMAGENYLIPTDAELQRGEDAEFETTRLETIIRTMEREVQVNLLFVDACRNNPFGRTRSTGPQGLGMPPQRQGTFISFATQPDGVTEDGRDGEHSPYVAALLRHLRTPGRDIELAMKDVMRDVAAATANRQIPWSSSSLLVPVVLSRPAPIAPTAPQPEDTGRRIALVIGNSKYGSQNLLPNPTNDAKAVAAALRRLQFDDVIEGYDLNHQDMTKVFKDFGDKSTDADWAFVFYAGHGIEVNGRSFLMPVDAKVQRDTHVDDETLSLERVLEKVEPARKLKVVFLDACRDNPFAKKMIRSGGAKRAGLGGGLGQPDPSGDVLVFYSAKHGEVAYDGEGTNSPFTEALLQYIEDPKLDLITIFGKVRQAVLKKTISNQRPHMYGSPPAEQHFLHRRRP